MREIDKAVELLKPLFEGLAKDRDSVVDVYAECCNGEDYIVTVINGCSYEVNVTAENVRSIVQSVVNRVVLKFWKQLLIGKE